MRKRTYNTYLWAVFFILFASCTNSTNLSPNPLFADHMVLQQKDTVAIWGTSNPNENISITGSWGDSITGKSDAEGYWKVRLQTPKAGGPYDVQISSNDNKIVLSDVLIGEVWLASGQSNMEMPLEGFLPKEPVDNYKEEIAAANFSKIRYFDVNRNVQPLPINDSEGEWTVTSPSNAHKFSATAYFFAQKLHQELGVPIGIISSTWGGTPIESWMSKENIKHVGEFSENLKTLNENDIATFKNWTAKFPSKSKPSNAENWLTHEFEDIEFSKIIFDDSKWKNTPKAGIIEELPVVSTDGIFWFRKTIQIDDISSDYTFIVKDGIDDMDATFINGTKIGSTYGYNSPRSYTIPKDILIEGKNTIAIRIVDNGGGGGFRSEILLQNSTSNKEINISKDWRFTQIAGVAGSKLIEYYKNEAAYTNPPKNIKFYSLTAKTPTVLYNGMIHPLVPYTIKGAIWHQGESNVGRAEQYLKLFPEMIKDWRKKWNSNFSFYFVQIAPYSYGNELSPALRDAQRKSLKTPKTGMAIIMDIGKSKSIHPGNKQDVGDRLARLALANDYNKAIVASGPLYTSQKITGNKISLEFNHTGGGLLFKDKNSSGFEIAGEDKKFVPAKATISENRVLVSAKTIRDPKYVRYAWKDYCVGTLYNYAGLPASSFNTE